MKLDVDSVTTDNATALLERGRAAIRSGDLAFDLAAVTVVDSAAVALLLAWQREAAVNNARITLANVPPALSSLASLYGVDALLGCPHRRSVQQDAADARAG